MIGFPVYIETKSKETFVKILEKEGCDSVKVEFARNTIGCLKFESSELNREIISYSVKLSAKSKSNKIITLFTEYRTIELYRNTFEIDNFFRVLDGTIVLLEGIKEKLHNIEIWILIPEKKHFNPDDYLKLNAFLNTLPFSTKGIFLNFKMNPTLRQERRVSLRNGAGRAGASCNVSAPPTQIAFPPKADPPQADIPATNRGGYCGRHNKKGIKIPAVF